MCAVDVVVVVAGPTRREQTAINSTERQSIRGCSWRTLLCCFLSKERERENEKALYKDTEAGSSQQGNKSCLHLTA